MTGERLLDSSGARQFPELNNAGAQEMGEAGPCCCGDENCFYTFQICPLEQQPDKGCVLPIPTICVACSDVDPINETLTIRHDGCCYFLEPDAIGIPICQGTQVFPPFNEEDNCEVCGMPPCWYKAEPCNIGGGVACEGEFEENLHIPCSDVEGFPCIIIHEGKCYEVVEPPLDELPPDAVVDDGPCVFDSCEQCCSAPICPCDGPNALQCTGCIRIQGIGDLPGSTAGCGDPQDCIDHVQTCTPDFLMHGAPVITCPGIQSDCATIPCDFIQNGITDPNNIGCQPNCGTVLPCFCNPGFCNGNCSQVCACHNDPGIQCCTPVLFASISCVEEDPGDPSQGARWSVFVFYRPFAVVGATPPPCINCEMSFTYLSDVFFAPICPWEAGIYNGFRNGGQNCFATHSIIVTQAGFNAPCSF
jgi:hypothetical protein